MATYDYKCSFCNAKFEATRSNALTPEAMQARAHAECPHCGCNGDKIFSPGKVEVSIPARFRDPVRAADLEA